MAEGRWEEIVEKTVLPAEGFWHLLRSQRKSQGVCVFSLEGQHGNIAIFNVSLIFDRKFPTKLIYRLKKTRAPPTLPNCYYL